MSCVVYSWETPNEKLSFNLIFLQFVFNISSALSAQSQT